MSPILVEVLKRDRAIVAFGLAGVAILAWTRNRGPNPREDANLQKPAAQTSCGLLCFLAHPR